MFIRDIYDVKAYSKSSSPRCFPPSPPHPSPSWVPSRLTFSPGPRPSLPQMPLARVLLRPQACPPGPLSRPHGSCRPATPHRIRDRNSNGRGWTATPAAVLLGTEGTFLQPFSLQDKALDSATVNHHQRLCNSHHQ